MANRIITSKWEIWDPINLSRVFNGRVISLKRKRANFHSADYREGKGMVWEEVVVDIDDEMNDSQKDKHNMLMI